MRLLNAWVCLPCVYTVFILCTFLSVLSYGASCNTDQNPTCEGDPILESICCTYPNICYWSNRDGTPACCPKGKDCRLLGGPAPNQISYTPTQVTQFQQTTLYVTQLSTTTVLAAPTTGNAVVSPSSAGAAAGTTFNSVSTNVVILLSQTAPVSTWLTTVNGQFVTVTQTAGAQRAGDGGNSFDLLRLMLVITGFLMNI